MISGTTHSRFGGMWIDRRDWQAELIRRQAARRITPAQAAQLQRFSVDGFLIMQQAVSPGAIDRFGQVLASAFRHGNPDLLYQAAGSDALRRMNAAADPDGSRIVDSHAVLPQALALFDTPPLTEFLNALFEVPPLLFRSLYAGRGSAQPLHQDTAYIVLDRPMEMVACWIALQDVYPGSAELTYVPGSHRLPDYDFGTGAKHWGSPDASSVAAWSQWLSTETARRNLPVLPFHARKGDILLWHGDLAHGAAPVTNPALTRQGIAAHFCPSSVRPLYFETPAGRSAMPNYNGVYYASEHYDLGASARPRGLMGRLAMAAANRRG
jgi:hypothetical protein